MKKIVEIETVKFWSMNKHNPLKKIENYNYENIELCDNLVKFKVILL